MKAKLVFIVGAEKSPEGQVLVAALEGSRVDVQPGIPPGRLLPVIVLPPKGRSMDQARYAHLSYCLVLAEPPTLDDVPGNCTYLSPAGPVKVLARAVHDWLMWAELDASESLESYQLLGRSTAFCQLVRTLHSVAAFNAATLLTGETGTGKEVAARAIHYWSARRDHPFVAVNCGGQNDDLFTSELFGHERGAFTGAKEGRDGLIGAAKGGTLFLDEVNSLSAKVQAALLRFMQDQTYRPLGGRRILQGDVRVVTATNQDLAEMAQQGRFRTDLLYRFDVLNVHLPPLRERQQDIPILARHFLERLCERYQFPPKRLDKASIAQLLRYSWPGNVRELQNYLHRLVAMGDGPGLEMLNAGNRGPGEAAEATGTVTGADERLDMSPFHDAKATAIEKFERGYVTQILKANDGNMSAAARMAGKERRTFSRLVHKYDVVDNHESSRRRRGVLDGGETRRQHGCE